MSRVQTCYLTAENTYRIRTVAIDKEWPLLALNKGDHQAHPIIHGAVYQKMDPLRCDTWEELCNAIPPVSVQTNVRHLMLVEDNSPWPILPGGRMPVEERLAFTNITYEEAYQKATERATKDDQGTPLLHLGFLTVVGIIVVLTLIFAIAAGQAIF